MIQPDTQTLPRPGAVLRYDVRASRPPGGEVLALIGSPMAAAGFATLASYFPDRTVVTYDPRGVERSERTDPTMAITPDVHAADLLAVLCEFPGSPIDVFATSGGAVNALALVAAQPDLVRTLVAHEPPAVRLLPDAAEALAACRAVRETYRRRGWGAGMAQFIALSSWRGPVVADFPSRSAPDPASFGLPVGDDGTRTDLLLGSDIVTMTHHRPDIARLRTASTRIVIAVGDDSDGELAHRGGKAVAARLDVDAIRLPGGHTGFLGGEYGQTGAPDAFAEQLRAVLANQGATSATELTHRARVPRREYTTELVHRPS